MADWGLDVRLRRPSMVESPIRHPHSCSLLPSPSVRTFGNRAWFATNGHRSAAGRQAPRGSGPAGRARRGRAGARRASATWKAHSAETPSLGRELPASRHVPHLIANGRQYQRTGDGELGIFRDWRCAARASGSVARRRAASSSATGVGADAAGESLRGKQPQPVRLKSVGRNPFGRNKRAAEGDGVHLTPDFRPLTLAPHRFQQGLDAQGNAGRIGGRVVGFDVQVGQPQPLLDVAADPVGLYVVRETRLPHQLDHALGPIVGRQLRSRGPAGGRWASSPNRAGGSICRPGRGADRPPPRLRRPAAASVPCSSPWRRPARRSARRCPVPVRRRGPSARR